MDHHLSLFPTNHLPVVDKTLPFKIISAVCESLYIMENRISRAGGC